MSLTRRALFNAGRSGLLGLGGTAFLVAMHKGDDVQVSKAGQRRQASRDRRSDRQTHGKHKKRDRRGERREGGRGRAGSGGIRLESGRLLPEKLVTEAAGTFSSHMLLPFEEFSSQAKLAEAVTEAESLGLFFLPKAVGVE